MIKNIVWGVLIISLISLSLFIYSNFFEKKIAYVDIPKVFNAFEMKKELEVKYKKTEELRKRVVDSLSFELQLVAQKFKANQKNEELKSEFDYKRELFFKTKNQLSEDNIALSNQYDKQILEQMSQYIMDYGKQNHFDLILGADGNGTLMYADEKLNISEEIITFINNKFKGIE